LRICNSAARSPKQLPVLFELSHCFLRAGAPGFAPVRSASGFLITDFRVSVSWFPIACGLLQRESGIVFESPDQKLEVSWF
jgi:hypothetical protein